MESNKEKDFEEYEDEDRCADQPGPPPLMDEAMMLPIFSNIDGPQSRQEEPVPELDKEELEEAKEIELLEAEGKLDDIDRRRKSSLKIMKFLLVIAYIAMVIFLLNPSQEGGGGPPPEGAGGPPAGERAGMGPGAGQSPQGVIIIAAKLFFADRTKPVYFKTVDTGKGKLDLYSYHGLTVKVKIGDLQFNNDVFVNEGGDLQLPIFLDSKSTGIKKIDIIKFTKDGYKTVDFRNILISNGMAYLPEIIIIPEKK